ncbi:NAD(P)-binding protein [Cadophora sp. DSE1049]|nr:NAD(P)-binding protein [Cadophora sp. DSE1049]
MAPSKVWLISGANTGFGLELSLKALQEGDKVIAAVRNPAKIPEELKRPEVATIAFDLSWPQDQINSFIKTAWETFGNIDVVVNNAAYAYMGAIEESTDEDIKKQYDINVFGVLRVIRAILPYLRAQKSGTIANISSIGGLHSYAANGMYCSTKFAIEGITGALQDEIAPFGLRALIIQPGYFRTNFLGGAAAGQNLTKPIAAYDGTTAHQAAENFEKFNGRQLGNPKLGAARIWEVISGEGLAKGKKKLLRLPLGSDTGAVMNGLSEELAETAKEYEEIWKSTDYKD